jgi:uncharacterized membrane protein YeaQ/YmgE (transglycosylase-associated protein family)
MTGIIWTAVIGLIAGFIARLVLPGPNNPPGFLVTMVLGISGAFVATFIGQGIGPNTVATGISWSMTTSAS